MTVFELKKWLDLIPSPEKTEVLFVTYGEQGRSNTYQVVKDVNAEFHFCKVQCVLHPEVLVYHKDTRQ